MAAVKLTHWKGTEVTVERGTPAADYLAARGYKAAKPPKSDKSDED